MNLRPLGRSGPFCCYSECLWSAPVDSIYTEIGWLPTSSLYRLSRVTSASLARYVMGFRWPLAAGRSHAETRPKEFSPLVVTGCLLLSRTVFDQFGVADGEPDSAVDIGSVQAHLRWVDTHDVIVSLTPVGADGPAESAGPVATLSEVPGAGESPAPAVVVTPHQRDELLGAAAAAAPSMVPRTPRHRSRRVAGTALEQARHGRPTGDHRAVPAPGRSGVYAGRAGGAESAPPFVNPQVTRSR